MNNLELTDFGFNWETMGVERIAAYNMGKDKRIILLGIMTPYHKLQVYSSTTGRSLRVWRDGKELK